MARNGLSDSAIPWYPYGTLDNFTLLEQLLGTRWDLAQLAGNGTVLDIGAADGELAFFLEAHGYQVTVIDNPPTNYNGCRALHALKETLGSAVTIHQMDIDAQFQLPPGQFGLAFFLGILYHLKNPYYALETLARQCRHVLLSTRVVRWNLPPGTPGRVALGEVPVAYLVGADECNNDATNFWMFSPAGLKRILQRCGWDVLEFITVGAVEHSDPATAAGDERAFCLARSRWL